MLDMSSSIKKVMLYGIMLLFVIFFIVLLTILERSNRLFINKTRKSDGITINYPYFRNKKIDKEIDIYLGNIKSCDNVNYQIYKVDNYISLLFSENSKDKVINYKSFIFDLDGNLTNIEAIVSDEILLKEKIDIYLDNNNLNKNYENIHYLVSDKEINAILEYNDNNTKTFTPVSVNFNEIEDILKIRYEIDQGYVKVLTTTTTTTTTKSYEGKKVISFTFDDGPSKYTTEIMDVLDKYGAKATFFEVGYMIKARSNIVLDVLSRGHEIGNHTTDHSNLNKLSVEKIKEKVEGNNATFKEITGMDFPLLRPPYGNCKQAIREYINTPIIKWSVDSRDWESRNKDKIIALVKKNTSSGDIVLFHDLYESTLEAIKVLVPYYYEQGYEIVTVSKLFEINNIPLENGKVYTSAKS